MKNRNNNNNNDDEEERSSWPPNHPFHGRRTNVCYKNLLPGDIIYFPNAAQVVISVESGSKGPPPNSLRIRWLGLPDNMDRFMTIDSSYKTNSLEPNTQDSVRRLDLKLRDSIHPRNDRLWLDTGLAFRHDGTCIDEIIDAHFSASLLASASALDAQIMTSSLTSLSSLTKHISSPAIMTFFSGSSPFGSI